MNNSCRINESTNRGFPSFSPPFPSLLTSIQQQAPAHQIWSRPPAVVLSRWLIWVWQRALGMRCTACNGEWGIHKGFRYTSELPAQQEFVQLIPRRQCVCSTCSHSLAIIYCKTTGTHIKLNWKMNPHCWVLWLSVHYRCYRWQCGTPPKWGGKLFTITYKHYMVLNQHWTVTVLGNGTPVRENVAFHTKEKLGIQISTVGTILGML